MMLCHEILQHSMNYFINKMGTLIAHQGARATKPGDNIFKDKLSSHISSVVFDWSNFHPTSQIICFNNDILSMFVTEGGWIGPIKSTTHFSNAASTCTGCKGISSQRDDQPTH